MDAIKIGKKLVRLRGNKTRKEVARDLNLSISAIAMYENGERIPRDEYKIKIANYYHATVQEIFYN